MSTSPDNLSISRLADGKGSRSVSAGNSRPRTWYGTALTIFLLSVLSLELQFVSGDGVNLGNIILVGGSLLAALLILASRPARAQPFRLIGPDYIYLAYVAWCGASSVWSVSMSDTLVQSVYLLAMWVGCTAVSRAPVESAVRFVIGAAAIIAILSFLAAATAPSLAFQPFSSTGLPELRGVFKHQLRLGAYESIAFCFIIIAAMNHQIKIVVARRRWRIWVTIGLIGLCMAAALARTYTLYAFLAIPISYFLSKRGYIRWATTFLIVGLVAIVMTYADNIVSALADSGEDVTLSGRTRVWQLTWDNYLMGSKLRGVGYATFDSPLFDYIWNRYRPAHPHNSFLSALFETGIIGCLLTVGLIISQIVATIRAASLRRQTSYGLFLVIMALLASITGVNYAGKPSVLFALTMLFVGIEARSVQAASTRRVMLLGPRARSAKASTLPPTLKPGGGEAS